MTKFIKTVKWMLIVTFTIFTLLAGYLFYVVQSFDTQTLPIHHGKVKSELYLGSNEKQALIVGLGGSEGGNAWTRKQWKEQRDKYVAQGYAFLAIGYFGMQDIPEKLDRIALEGVHDAILRAAANPKVDKECVAVIGGSKGAELALSLASHYKDIKAVVGIVPSHVVFAGLTDALTTSSFTYEGKQLPFVPVPWSTTPALLSGNLRKAFEIMLDNKEGVERATIKVENINGPIFLISGTKDEFWPSTEMSDKLIGRLENKKFPHFYQHIAIEGGHAAPLKHFDKIDQFLEQHFKSKLKNACN